MRGKAACERAFGVIRQLLFEHLTGYTGVDTADRGADPEGDAALTMDELGQLIATWIVGKHKAQWVIRRDPRDRRSVFFQDPVTHAWRELPWTGMPAAGQAPAFGDARVRDLLRKAGACGLRPKSDAELLPVLLEMIGAR